MTYSYHPHARRELNDKADYYDSIDLNLGDDFLAEIDDCISRILAFAAGRQSLRWEADTCE